MEASEMWDDAEAVDDPDLELLGEDDDSLPVADEDLFGIDTDDD
jgi:hypothetical protein